MMIFRKRLLCVTVCLCMIFGMMPATAQAATGETAEVSGQTVEAYKVGETSFNVKGVDGDRKYWTTFVDLGYDTAVSVDGGKTRNKPGRIIASGLSLDVTLAREGSNYVKVQYTLSNTGSKAHTVKVGGHADVMIDNNDKAPICATETNGKTLLMTGSPRNDYAFKLVATTCDTLWYGYYGKRVRNCFTDMKKRGPSNVYKKDSGISYSWKAAVEPGQTWSRYVLIGTGSEEQMRVETPPIPQPEEIVPDPEITLNTSEMYFTEGDSLPADWNSYIASSEGEVKVTDKPADTDTPGTYTVKYTATNSKGTANASLKVHILYKPAALSQTAAARVTNTNNFTLTATMLQTGGVNWTETGFVYGALQNPTVTLNDGSVKTASAVNTKNGSIKASVTGLTEGITYYARAYAKAADGTIIYGNQSAGFGLNAPDYGTFQVTNSGSNTFTISRTGGTDGEQTVYYRTVNGSAVGGTHFTHAAGSVKFAKGESSKNVTVTEFGANEAYRNSTATACTNANRTYQMEIYRVNGGATIDGNKDKATRTMTKSSSYTIDRNVYTTEQSKVNITKTSSGKNGQCIADATAAQGGKDSNVNFVKSRNGTNYSTATSFSNYYSGNLLSYLQNTCTNWFYRYEMYAYEQEDGWEHAYIGTSKLEDVFYTVDKGGPVKDIEGQLWACTFQQGKGDNQNLYKFPSTSYGGGENSCIPYSWSGVGYKMNNSICYAFPKINESCFLHFSATGGNSDIWWINGLTSYALPYDAQRPEPIVFAPMAGGTYLAGDSVTISLIFNEIVDSVNSSLTSNSKITTNWGEFTYAGGEDTNVLYFTGTVPENASKTISLRELNCYKDIDDMSNNHAGYNSNTSGAIKTNVIVANVAAPTAKVTSLTNSNGVLTGKITATNAAKLEYVWSKTSTVPASGWRMLRNTTSSTVTTRQTSGTWYLHARATNSDGRTATAYKSVAIPATGSSTYAAPELTVSADNSNWAKTRSITVTRSPGNATVKVKTPEGNTKTVTGSSYTAETNGVYTFTLTSNGETVTRQAAVSRLDNTAPTIEINDLNNAIHADQVTLTFSVTDGGSGVGNVTAKWNNSGVALKKNSDGTYTTTCPSATGNWKLAVTAADVVGNSSNKVSKTYTVNLDKPVLTVTKTGSTKQGVSYNYSVNAKGNEDVTVYLPDGTRTGNLTGSFTLTEAGSYIIAVTDKAGHFVSQEITVPETVDGVAPEVRLYADDSEASDKLTVEVMVYEKRGMPTVKQDSSAVTVTADTEDEGNYIGLFTVAKGGEYTVTATDAAGNTGNGSITVYALVNDDNTALKLPAADGTYGTLPTPDARTGYTFDGWYTAETEGTRANSGMKVETAYTLYARWTPVTYNVTLVGDRDSGTDLTSYTYGEGANLPTDWTKQCAEFDGWYTAETGDTKTDKIVTDEYGDKTYYARWKVVHTWVDATCTAPKTCSVCNITGGKALGHKFETTWSKDADKHWHKCSRCDEQKDRAAHSWDEGIVTAEPGCTSTGTRTFTCNVCSEKKTGIINAKGHTEGAAVRENEVAATCTSAGSYDEVVYCADCREELSREKKTIDALGHDYVHHEAKTATCTEKGWEAYDTCLRCDYTTYKETPAAGHKFEFETAEEKYLKSEATCAAPAEYYKSCKCGEIGTETFKYGEVNPDRHTGGTEIRNALKANHVLQTKGYTGDTYCTGCNKMLGTGTEILPGDHITDSVWKMNENRHWKECSISGCGAVIENTGQAHIYDGDGDADCNICGYTRTIIPIHKHDLKTVTATAATCTSTGNIEYYKCEDCGKLFSDPAGTKEITAESVVTGKLPHSPKELPAVEATCENTGLSAGSKCEICGAIITEQTVTAAKGHDFAGGMWKHDTAQHWKKCSRCDVTDTKAEHVYDNEQDNSCNVCGYNRDITPVHIHNWAAEWSHDIAYHWHECLSSGCDVTENSLKAGYAAHIEVAAVRENETAATCTTDGSYDEVVYCTDCHAEISRTKNITKALDHEWGNWVVTKSATSSEDGEEQRICMREPSHVETKIIPALTHTHQYSEVVKDEYIKTVATCTEPAVYYKSCECGAKSTGTFIYGDVLGHDFRWQHDENQHWKKCSRCDVTDTKAEHVYDNEQDNSCNVCGYNRDITPVHIHNWADAWSHNTAYHWHECLSSGCDVTENSLKAGYAAHVLGPAATETEPQICTDCGYIIQAALGHTHNLTKVTGTPATCTEAGTKDYWMCAGCNKIFEDEHGNTVITDINIPAKGHSYSSVWSSDVDDHWKICTECKAIVVDKEAHKWNEGEITTPATTTSKGVKTFTCEVCKATKTEPVAKIPSGGGVITPPKTDTITADVTGDKTSVKITAEVSGDTASIAEIGKNDIDKAGAGVDITIDLTVIPNEVVSVTVTKKSLDNIYESKSDNVSIKLTGSTVNMDRDTLKNIIDQMKGSDLKLVVDKHQDALESMNKVQQDAVKDMREPKIMDAYFISGGIRITDFKGGSVDIKVPYPDKKGVKAWYIDDNGIKEPVPVSYDGKTAVITVNHFSHYVLEEDDSDNVEPVPVKKTVDKVLYVKSAKYSKKTGTKITFNKVSGADGYYVYGNRCNTDKVYKFKKLATLKGNDNTVFVHKKTAKNTFYKYYIKAYKVVDGKRVTVSTSREIHFVTDVKGYKYGNPTKVTLSVKKYTLSKGKTFNLKNRVKVYSSKKVLLHTDKIRYVSSDSSIAKVNSKGKITAKKAGSCNIYAIAQNGKAAKIAVTVK